MTGVLLFIAGCGILPPDSPAELLRVGVAGHAFDHLGAYGEQADACVAAGANILYATGVGNLGYSGLPADFDAAILRAKTYSDRARQLGARRMIGYLCATSIIGLEQFDAHWTPEFRGQFATHPREWLQRDAQNRPLPSWYGGEYRPACMNHPDWRAYQRAMVAAQLGAGHDGVFFDNPTVHQQGCYCEHCLRAFGRYLAETESPAPQRSVGELRAEAVAGKARDFARFRTTIARDFLAEMRTLARTIRPDAWITANNSLNSPRVFYSQSKRMGYSIYELSKAEDFVVVEDMETQPRLTDDGKLIEYGPTYRQVSAIAHGKPVVAVTIAEAEYHTPPRLVRLAMAEAAAHGCSYLSWPTWPEDQRARMIAQIRPQADFLRTSAELLNDAETVEDVLVFLPMRGWLDHETCPVDRLTAELTRHNVCYRVFCEDDFTPTRLMSDRATRPVLLLNERTDCTPREQTVLADFQRRGGRVVEADSADWLTRLQSTVGTPTLRLAGSDRVRAIVTRQPGRWIVHLYNLGIKRLNSFTDAVEPVEDIELTLHVPGKSLLRARLLSADSLTSAGDVPVTHELAGDESRFKVRIPRLEVSALLVLDAS